MTKTEEQRDEAMTYDLEMYFYKLTKRYGFKEAVAIFSGEKKEHEKTSLLKTFLVFLGVAR